MGTNEIAARSLVSGTYFCDPSTGLWARAVRIQKVKDEPENLMIFMAEVPGRLAVKVHRDRLMKVQQFQVPK